MFTLLFITRQFLMNIVCSYDGGICTLIGYKDKSIIICNVAIHLISIQIENLH
jgi:hypothetical protein